jgi:endoglucanase
MRKLYLVISIFACLATVACTGGKGEKKTTDAPLDTFVGAHGQLSVKGVNLLDAHGERIALHGVSLSWHNWWPRFYDRNTVAWLKSDWNATLIRAAIGVEPEGAYLGGAPEKALLCLNTVVNAAIENDMYVIIDWHAHYIHLDEAKEFFSKAAENFGGYPNVIYEVFNEPWGEEMSWDEVKAYSVEVIKAIRAKDPDNLILVGSPNWDQSVDLAADAPIVGYDNIMYTLHFYAATHKQSLRDKANYALSKGLPLFVSECAGMEASGDGAVDYAEWTAWTDWMRERQLSWAIWSVSDKQESCSMIASEASPVSGWTDVDLKEWGRVVKQLTVNVNKE